MTATLYLNASVFPAGASGSSTVALTVQVFLASKFLNPPTGFTTPPGTPDGTATCSPTGTITGLNNTVDYYALCYNPEGFIHWFKVDWSSGNTSEAPLNLTVPLFEGANPLGLVSGFLAGFGAIS